MEDSSPGRYQLTLTIRDSDKVLFKGIVGAITSFNDKGLFDILPVHENFITIIREKIIVHIGSEVKEFIIKKGILKVEENNVDVFLGTDKIGEN